MAANTQFAIAVHLMAGLGYASGRDIHSCELASSVNTCPSFVRRILAKLSKADLIATATGKGGRCWLAKNPARVSLRDIYEAVDAPKAFAIHQYAVQRPCPVSRHIKASLHRILDQAQESMEQSLAQVSVADVIADMKKKNKK
jgi:Rrf2 family protein